MPVNDTVGGDIISAWLVKPGVCWIQTNSARHARRLSQRSDTRIVGNGVVGGFLRIFEAQHSLSWAKRFIARHETNEVPTGAAFLNPESPTSRRNLELAVRVAVAETERSRWATGTIIRRQQAARTGASLPGWSVD